MQQLSGISNLFTFSAAVVRANGFDDDATAQVRALTLTLTLSHGAGATFLLLTFPLQPSSYYWLSLPQVVLSLGMTHVASTLLSGALMDRVGRRPLLLVSIALMCAGL